MQWIKQCLKVLLCLAFVSTPLSHAFANVDMQGDILSGELDKAISHEMTHIRHEPVAKLPNSIYPDCCEIDHCNEADGLCSDCLTFNIVIAPTEENRNNCPDSPHKISRGQSYSVISDTPVPKI